MLLRKRERERVGFYNKQLNSILIFIFSLSLSLFISKNDDIDLDDDADDTFY
jgi:hypothetical protein